MEKPAVGSDCVSLECGERRASTVAGVILEGAVMGSLVLKCTEGLFGHRKCKGLNDILVGELSVTAPWPLLQASSFLLLSCSRDKHIIDAVECGVTKCV